MLEKNQMFYIKQLLKKISQAKIKVFAGHYNHIS